MRSTPTTYTVHITRAHATRPHTTLAHMPQSCTLHSHTPYAHTPHVHTPLFCSHAARQCVTAWVKRQNIPQSSVGFASGSSGSESLLASPTLLHSLVASAHYVHTYTTTPTHPPASTSMSAPAPMWPQLWPRPPQPKPYHKQGGTRAWRT